MSGEPIPLDQLLDMQGQPSPVLATVQRVPDDDTRVRVTPYAAGAGCLCSFALNVTKDAIESVTSTDEVHVCCGKTLKVVTIKFGDATMEDVFQQIAASVNARRNPGYERQGHADMGRQRTEGPSPPCGSSIPSSHSGQYSLARPPQHFGRSDYPPAPRFAESGSARPENMGMFDCLMGCEDAESECIWQCWPDDSFEYCKCMCRNYKRMCYAGCGGWSGPLEFCRWETMNRRSIP